MKGQPTIIGIDGGASKVSANIVKVSKDGSSFTLGKENSIKEYHNYPDFQTDFKPVTLPTQLEQIQNNDIVFTPSELKQSKAYYRAFNDAISDLVKLTKAENVLIGIGMPGVKTADGRGIAAMANGPRMPYFAAEIEQQLLSADIALATPIFKLGSDADYCGIGEEYAVIGAFRNVKNAYYLGGGTGAADALKLQGKLIPFDECKDWIAKTWEMSDANGKSMETYCSANGIQSVYSNFAGLSQSELKENKIYLEQILELAYNNDTEAITTWQTVSKNLANLLFERISTIYCGSQNNYSFINHSKPLLDSNHIYKNILLDRIVIGQRLGKLFQNPLAQKYLIEPLIKKLSELISKSEFLDERAKSHYLKSGKFDNKIIIVSQLREAPALGAGIDAFINFKF
ncbi:MAG: ROK family protein [Candidatus Marinimicrobia bacterium]|nr:ROK family protein [Candidatus Neomarinimicrobiota bacterium]